jgi:hypothetical protein
MHKTNQAILSFVLFSKLQNNPVYANNLPDFPPKLFKIFISDEFLRERKEGLDHYFKALPKSIRDSEILKEFFGMI